MSILDLVEKQEKFDLFLINMASERFRQCFSKLETLTAIEYIITFPGRIRIIPVEMDWNGATEYQIERMERSRDPDHESRSTEFHDRFDKSVSGMPNPVRLSYQSGFDQLVDHRNPYGRLVFLGGFNTEFEILLSVQKLFLAGQLPVVISDLCSSPSERAHFSSLESISRFAEIIDTRDLQKSEAFGRQ